MLPLQTHAMIAFTDEPIPRVKMSSTSSQIDTMVDIYRFSWQQTIGSLSVTIYLEVTSNDKLLNGSEQKDVG